MFVAIRLIIQMHT